MPDIYVIDIYDFISILSVFFLFLCTYAPFIADRWGFHIGIYCLWWKRV